MRKVLFAFATIALISAASSCKKCGYCKYQDGSTSEATCNQGLTSAVGVDLVKEAKADCASSQGTWVEDK